MAKQGKNEGHSAVVTLQESAVLTQEAPPHCTLDMEGHVPYGAGTNSSGKRASMGHQREMQGVHSP